MRQIAKLIVFEGFDNVGKSTIARKLASTLQEDGYKVDSYSFPGKASGSLGCHIYRLHHNPRDFDIHSIDPTAQQILHIAAHVDSIQSEILPSIAESDYVLLDRYWWSTAVYGATSGARSNILKAALEAEKQAWDGVLPARLFLIQRSNAVAENVDNDAFQKAEEQYELLATKFESKYPIHLISNDGSIEAVICQLREIIGYK